MAGVAMQGLGTALQMRAANRAKNARNAAMDANIKRNRDLENEAALAIGKSRDEFERTENFDPGVQNAATELAAQYNANTKPMPVNVATKEGVPDIVADTRPRSLRQLMRSIRNRTKPWQTLIRLVSTSKRQSTQR